MGINAKRFWTVALAFIAGLLATACKMDHGTTPLAPTVITYGGSYNFSPSAVTIKSGMTVIWDKSFACGHTLTIDNGAGACVTNYSCYPVTLNFPDTGTYNFHCDYHSSCGPTACTNCTGMVGRVVVQ